MLKVNSCVSWNFYTRTDCLLWKMADGGLLSRADKTAEALWGFHQLLETGCRSKNVRCQQFMKSLPGFSGLSAGERRTLSTILSSRQPVCKHELSIRQRFLTQGQLVFNGFLSGMMNSYFFFLSKASSLVGQVHQIHGLSDRLVLWNDYSPFSCSLKSESNGKSVNIFVIDTNRRDVLFDLCDTESLELKDTRAN